jgi:UrcA family protein
MAIQNLSGAVRRPQIPLIVLLCSLVGAGAASAANAAGAPVSDVPQVTVKFSPAMLTTEEGARSVYQRIVRAAELACPDTTTGSRITSDTVRKCREQAVARAVRQINNPQLAEVYTNSTKHS